MLRVAAAGQITECRILNNPAADLCPPDLLHHREAALPAAAAAGSECDCQDLIPEAAVGAAVTLAAAAARRGVRRQCVEEVVEGDFLQEACGLPEEAGGGDQNEYRLFFRLTC